MVEKFIHKSAQKISIFSGIASYARGPLFLFPILLFALEAPSSPSIPNETLLTYTPWLTGPFLAPTSNNMEPKHPAIQPSLTVFNTYGSYNSNWGITKQESVWAINPLIDFQFGITKNFGIEALVSFISNFTKGKSANYFQDTIVFFGYQVSNDIKGSWIPDCRLLLQETFPTGKYQKLDPSKEGIDSTGFGSFQTGPVVAFRKLFYLPESFFSLEWSLTYLFPSSVDVKGFNSYGGGYGTDGKVLPGQTLVAFLSGEYSINQRWALAFDSELLYQSKSQFTGQAGVTSSGTIANTELPNSLQISFAPEFEYNFNINSGLLAGVWFTVVGKNSEAFASAFLSYLYIF